MSLITIGMTAAWVAAAVLIAFYAIVVASELSYVVLADGRRAERSIPFLFKLLFPLASSLSGVIARSKFLCAEAKASEIKLTQAGFEGLISGVEFVSLKLLFGWVFPELWLGRVIKRRHRSIFHALPFTLDLLTLSVEAGLDFMSALQRSTEMRKLDSLNEELIRMNSEIKLGVSRSEALQRLSQRVGQRDLRNVAYALIQAEELGVSIGPTLRIQSNQLREIRFDYAERLANLAPVKMLGPLMLCIFPAVFIILLGPIILQVLKGGMF